MKLAREPVFDALRAVAVLLVLGAHVPGPGPEWLTPVVQVWVRLGWTGVDLFLDADAYADLSCKFPRIAVTAAATGLELGNACGMALALHSPTIWRRSGQVFHFHATGLRSL